jgi:L-fuculose-phosphate aldolase
VTQAVRAELIATARRMSEAGLAPGTTGNASVRTPRGLLVTPSGMPYDQLRGDDAVAIDRDGTVPPGQRAPSTEWQLHRDLYAARPDVAAIVHTHSLFCTTVSCLRRPIPAIHYMVVRAGGDDIPCADYATFGTAELAASVIRALGRGRACLMANHGMVALGDNLGHALQLAAEVETLAAQYWHAAQLTHLGPPHVLAHDELDRVRAQFAGYGQPRRGPRRR